MFIVWGSKGYKKFHGNSNYTEVCGNCNNEVTYEVLEYGSKFTIFWIPLFSTSRKYFLSCPICRYGYDIKKDEINSYLEN